MSHFAPSILSRHLKPTHTVLLQEKAPKLLTQGQPGLAPQRVTRDNEIAGGEFDTEWLKYGGRPY